MQGLEILLAHLVGDYLLQDDWMASNKTNPYHGYLDDDARRLRQQVRGGYDLTGFPPMVQERLLVWKHRRFLWYTGHVACTMHCLWYTLSVLCFCHSWITWWGLLLCFVIHWPIDRFRLARRWMESRWGGQSEFANGPFGPWSVVVVDNIWHLLTLYFIYTVC